jgi:chemotaxis protein MotB
VARRRKKHEEHANHEAWAIPYGDLITLLLAFFVVMYAISTVNEGKYRVLSDSLFAAFRGTPRTMQPIQVGEKQVGSGADIKTTLVEQAMLEGQPRSLLTPIPVETGLPQQSRGTTSGELDPATVELARVAEEVARAMEELVREELIVVRRQHSWIEVEIRTDILFPSGSATLSESAIRVIQQLADVLRPFPNPIRVEGHTDNRPIRTVLFRSNWELSAARAGSVVHVLSSRGVAPTRLAVIGFGEFRPAQPNTTPESRNANRRVVLVILSPDAPASKDPAMERTPAETEKPVTEPLDAQATAQETHSAPESDEQPVTPSSVAAVPEVFTSRHGIVSAPQ